MNKPVYFFGNPYYENFNNTYKINNIKDLRNELLKTREIKSNVENFITFFSNVYEGNTAMFYSENFNDETNLQVVINSFNKYFEDMSRVKC